MVANERIQLEIVGHSEIDENTLRFFSSSKGEYSINIQSDEKGTMYEFSLYKSDLKHGGALSVVPCFSKKYIDWLRKGGRLIIDDDIVMIKESGKN